MTQDKVISKLLLIIALIVISLTPAVLNSQSDIQFQDVLTAARSKSYSSELAEKQVQIADQDYNIFRSSLKPAFFLEGQIPGFFSSSSAITQPNGTIEFQRVSQNNASISLFGQQNIAATGARLFVQSDLQRFDDFTLNNRLYNGIPLRIGISQPIFAFNQIKWQKKIAPIQLEQAKSQYTFDIENTQFQATNLYFQVLVAVENKKIAALNSEVNEKLITIANKRLELGKISEDEKLQLEIQLDNALLNLRRSDFQFQAAVRTLEIYLYDEANSNLKADDPTLIVSFEIPKPFDALNIEEEEAVQYALTNRPEIIAFRQQLIEAEQNIAQTKANTGPQANLFASFGLARGSENLENIYSDPFTEQQLNLSFSVPIVDWGRRKSSRKQAKIQMENTLLLIEQGKLQVENNTRLKVREFLMLQDAVKDQEAIRSLAEKRFEIANERYILGAISITDFTLAQREKDQTRRSYIQTLSDYWNSYYALRLLTGFDFASQQRITY